MSNVLSIFYLPDRGTSIAHDTNRVAGAYLMNKWMFIELLA